MRKPERAMPADGIIAVPGPAWRLTPAFRLQKVQLVEYRNSFTPYYKDEKGKFHTPNSVFATKDEAIASGGQRLMNERERLNKMEKSWQARLENLRAKKEQP